MIKRHDLILNVLTDIEEGIGNGISVDILAKKYSLSEVHLRRLFKFTIKQTIANYIRSRKLMISLVDLLKPESNLSNIAVYYGFAFDASYIRAFKREFGVTPGAFRKMRMAKRPRINHGQF
jgi:AraC family transcriptional regulator